MKSSGERVILLIDDDEVDRELVQRLISDDFRVEARTTATDGVAALDSWTPDCILLDYRLPDGDGLEVLQRIHEHTPDLPVVILTRSGNEIVATEALKNGDSDTGAKILKKIRDSARIERR